MKKKSASRSAFFNLRVLIALFIVLAGAVLALIGLGTFSGLTASSAQAQQRHKIINIQGLPPGFDCATIHEKGIDRMEGFRAGLIMIACGEATGGLASPYPAFSQLLNNLTAPLAYGAADVDLVTGTETSPHIIQSETYSTANPDNPNQICVAFNDSRGAAINQFSGVSCSTDGGLTFTRVTNASGQGPFANTFGDPVILYNKPTQTWFTVWLDGNGSCTLGGYKSSNPSDPNSWTHFCVHTNASDDRESGWADNTPSSPFFGRMYVSWNNFSVGGGALQVTFSTDNGATWHAPVSVTSTFVRDVQITGDQSGNGTIYIAGMDEGGGGFPHNDTNKIFRSTDGGNTWTNTYTGSPFAGPGVQACSDNPYFSCMFSDQGGFWRHEGWGEPAVLNGVVHLVYAQHGAGTDPGDVFYIRSTDSGVTFSAPFKLNTDSTTRPQWQPNLSVSPGGTVFAVWYDARESTTCAKGNPGVPCYRMWGRKSTDNGATWLADMTFSDVVAPLPGQSDPNIVTGYAGDYDYGSALLAKHVTSWDDGRVAISGASQQDTFFDQELAGTGTPTPTPTASPTPTPTASPTATPGCTPGWSAGANLPSVGVRLVGVYFPGNGKFYAMGGRSSDVAGSDFTNPFEYDPNSNTWATKGATYPDNQVNNMACGVLIESGTPYIYCVGGSAAGATTATARVFRYNPVTDTIDTLTAPDNWPGDAAGTILPGGFAVVDNKLEILGGFNINVASTNQIWQFDPTAAVGAKWTQRVNTPVAIMYAPTCAINGIIYVAGASDFQGGLVVDTTNSFSFDPANNTTGSITAIPRATGETRALSFNGLVLVMGGGRVAPNPSNEVDIYDPGTNTWTTGAPVPAFMNARRNFPTDTNGADHIWLSGGYDITGLPTDSTEVFCQSGGTPTPTPTASPSATATATGTPSATPTCTPGGSPGPWTQAAPVGVDHYGGFMDSDGTVAYEGGGYSFSVGDNTNEFGKFDPVANTWTSLTPVPDLTNAEASAVYAPNVNKLFVFGGDSPNTGHRG